MKLARILCCAMLSCFFLSACKTKKTDEDIIIPPEKLYSDGISLLEKHKYIKAADEFSKIFYQSPGDPLSPQAELMQAYSLFLASQYDESVDVIDVFIKLHPMHQDIAYAYYLKSCGYYMQISNVTLDQSRTFMAKESFEELIRLFPNTKYSVDAALKIDLVNDHLAGAEMEVGRYYLKQNDPIAAINRYQIVINEYQTTSHVPEALYRLAESYAMLGLPDVSRQYSKLLIHNYRENKWSKYTSSLEKFATKKY